MKTAAYILEFLNANAEVSVEQFGVFGQKTFSAEFRQEDQSLFPPGKEIVFFPDAHAKDAGLKNFIATKEDFSEDDASLKIQKLVNVIRQETAENQPFEVADLGIFTLEDSKLTLQGKKIYHQNPDFYGLEEIKISEIESKPSEISAETETDYQFNNAVLWLFLLIIPVLGMMFLGFTKRDFLFGKKSIGTVAVTTSTHRIKEKPSVKAKKPVADSLKTDTNKAKK